MHKQIGEIPSPSEVRFGKEFFGEPEFNETEKAAPHFEQERRDEDVASERKQERTTEEFSGRLKAELMRQFIEFNGFEKLDPIKEYAEKIGMSIPDAFQIYSGMLGEKAPPENPDFWDNPTEILLPNDTYGVTIEKAANRLYNKLKTTGWFFVQGTDKQVVQVEMFDGRAFINPVKADELRGIVERYFKVKKVVPDKRNPDPRAITKKHVVCSKDIASALLAHSDRMILDPLERVVNCPVIDRNGKICRKGYHRHLNGGTYITGGGVEDVPLDKAIASIKDIFSEYDFYTPGDRLRAIAMLLSPAFAHGDVIKTHFPIDIAEADASQSGKTYRQKVAAAVYNEILHPITKSDWGVAKGIDESLGSKLLAGNTFIQIDNIRGEIDSQILESSITSEFTSVRIAYRPPTNVRTKGVTFMITSNGVEITPDLANRSIMTRIKKREDHRYKDYPEGDLLEHVQANQGYYLGCVFAVIREWIRQDRPTDYDTRHSFRKWTEVLNWITKTFFRSEDDQRNGIDLLFGHAEIQERAADPVLNMVRALALEMKNRGRLGNFYRVDELLDITVAAMIEIPGKFPNSEAGQRLHFGRLLARVFKDIQDTPGEGEAIEVLVDSFVVQCSLRRDQHRNLRAHYRFEESLF
jgi:hypothetical protein